MAKGSVYILKSLKNNSFYIGSSKDVNRRLRMHNDGLVKATRYLRPFVLMFFQEYDNITDARRIEYKLKKFKSKYILHRIISDRVIKLGL
jgi:putative endonuclease